MDNNYNTTLQQVCDEIRHCYAQSSSLYDRFSTFLFDVGIQIQEGIDTIEEGQEYLVVNLDAANQVVDVNGAIQQLSGLSDLAYKLLSNVTRAVPFSVEFKDIFYHEETFIYTNIMDSLIKDNNGVNTTLLDYAGNPMMNMVWKNGKTNVDSYFRSIFQYGITTDTYSETRLILHYKDQSWDMGAVTFNNIGENTKGILRIPVDNITNENWSIYYNIMHTIMRNKELADLIKDISECLSQGDYSKADVFANLNRYLSSSYQDVRNLVNSMVTSAGISIQSAISKFINLFSGKQTIIENPDGSIQWVTQGQFISVNVAQALGSAFLQAGQIIGQMMLFVGSITLKVAGGVIMVVASAIQSITVATAQVTGASPSLNTSASDRIYKYPIFQCNSMRIHLPSISPSQLPDVLQNIEDCGRFKIMNPFCYIYCYNVRYISDKDITCDVKVFPTIYGEGLSALSANELFPYTIKSVAHPDPNVGVVQEYLIESQNTVDINRRLKKLADNMAQNMYQIDELDKQSLNSDKWVEANMSLWSSVWAILYGSLCNTHSAASEYIFSYMHDQYFADGYDSNHVRREVHSLHEAINNVFVVTRRISSTYRDDMTCLNNTVSAILEGFNDNKYSILMIESLLNSIGFMSFRDDPQNTDSTYYDGYFITDPDAGNLNKLVIYTVGFEPNYDITDYNIEQILSFNNVGIFAFLSPGMVDFRTVIMTAVVSAIIVTAVAVGIVVARAVIKRSSQARWLNKTDDFKKDAAALKEMKDKYPTSSAEDKKAYNKLLRSYERKLAFYNTIWSITGHATYDWLNDWYNEPSPVLDGETVKDVQESIPTPGEATTSSGVVDTIMTNPTVLTTISMLTGIPIEQLNSIINKEDSSTTNVVLSLDTLYKLISGQHYTC